MRPHRRQPTRLPRPWDSPGKNTGVGCHFLLQCMKVKRESEVVQSCLTLSDPMDCSLPGSSVHGIFQARVLEWGAIASSVRHMLSSLPPPSPSSIVVPFYRKVLTLHKGPHLTEMFFTLQKEPHFTRVPPSYRTVLYFVRFHL